MRVARGAVRFLQAISGAANEGRSVSFTPVAQEAGRKVALSIFSQIISLDISFHMQRRTVRAKILTRTVC